MDYRELNKKTTKDAYPLPLIDEVQDQLSGSAVFSKLDLQSGYWQLPVDPNDREKSAFSPGPGMGSFEFLTNAFWTVWGGTQLLQAAYGYGHERVAVCVNIHRRCPHTLNR